MSDLSISECIIGIIKKTLNVNLFDKFKKTNLSLSSRKFNHGEHFLNYINKSTSYEENISRHFLLLNIR